MGWISERHMRTGESLNRNPSRQRKGPLRKIVVTLRHSTGIFDPAYVELECGHKVHSHGQFKARCVECARKEW
jgi:hypothetical protein